MLLPLLALSTQDIDPRGPILSYQNPPIVKGRQSVQVGEKPTPIHPADRSPGIGQWIWLAESKKGVPARFLYSVDLSEKPKEVRAWITAEARYRMWINGRLAARGPADSGRDYDSGPCGPWLLDVRSLTQYFKKGTNIVAVEVFPEPLVQFDASTGQPGLRADFLTLEQAPSGFRKAHTTSIRMEPKMDFGSTSITSRLAGKGLRGLTKDGPTAS